MNTDRMRARAEAVQDAAAEHDAAGRHAEFLQTPLGQHVAEMGKFFRAFGDVLVTGTALAAEQSVSTTRDKENPT